MSDVWLLESGEYSDHRVEGIFASEGSAYAAKALFHETYAVEIRKRTLVSTYDHTQEEWTRMWQEVKYDEERGPSVYNLRSHVNYAYSWQTHYPYPYAEVMAVRELAERRTGPHTLVRSWAATIQVHAPTELAGKMMSDKAAWTMQYAVDNGELPEHG